MKIRTLQKRIPWGWAAIILFPWFANGVREQISTAGIVFTLKKFTDDPQLIGFVGSTNQAFGFLVGALCSFASDRIWTPIGRRRPFLITAAFGSCILCLLIPVASSLWMAIVIIVLYQFVVDTGTPFEATTMEVIPTQQRGRAGIFTHSYKALAIGLALAVLIGRFDNNYALPGGIVLTGEQVMYWTNAAILFIVGCIFLFLLRETRPPDHQPRKFRNLQLWTIFREITRMDILPLLGLAFVMQSLWMGLGQFESLLITEQWGYEKSQFGNIMSLSLLLSIPFVFVGGWLSDKVDRMLLLRIGLVVAFTFKLFYYVYAEYIAPNGIPPIPMVIVLGLFKGGIGSMMAVACIPLIFDFVRPSRLGTLSAGMGIAFSLVSFVNINLVGAWVKFSSKYIFGMPEGTYKYIAGYHLLLLWMVLGFAYFTFFNRLVQRGVMVKPDPV